MGGSFSRRCMGSSTIFLGGESSIIVGEMLGQKNAAPQKIKKHQNLCAQRDVWEIFQKEMGGWLVRPFMHGGYDLEGVHGKIPPPFPPSLAHRFERNWTGLEVKTINFLRNLRMHATMEIQFGAKRSTRHDLQFCGKRVNERVLLPWWLLFLARNQGQENYSAKRLR